MGRAISFGRAGVLCTVALVLSATGVAQSSESRLVPATPTTQPNVVFILTDDQRWDSTAAMPYLQSDLAAHGVTFDQSFVVNSLCCPSRASSLTGQYSHTTQVYSNAEPNGGFHKFNDVSTVATWLHGAGYRTGLIGKYLNGYKAVDASYVPPGWDRWFAVQQGAIDNESAYYYNYGISDQGTTVAYGSNPADYATDVFSAQADTFIRGVDEASPLFLYFAPTAPHSPAKPADRHTAACAGQPLLRPPSYNEGDVSDKPAYIRALRKIAASRLATIDSFQLNQCRSLMAVDDAIHTIVTALADTGRLANTMIVFTSDNGLTLAEHRWAQSKLVPYEESIRVPMVVRYDPLTAVARTNANLVTNIDLAPTFAELAGVSAPNVEGLSLLPLLAGEQPVTWRTDFLIEHYKFKDGVPTYCAVRTTTTKLITYNTGEQEFYDLSVDPFELVNRATNPAYASAVAALRTRSQQLCAPAPPGFVWPYDALAPTVPSGLVASEVATDHVTLGWQPSTDNVAVTGYTVYRGGVAVGSVAGTTLSFTDATVTGATAYSYTVDAVDAAGNRSAASGALAVVTPDGQAPTAPTGLVASEVATDHVTLGWQPSTDNVAVTGYAVYRDSLPVGSVDGSSLSFTDATVSAASTYHYTVEAVDAAGNPSAMSAEIEVVTPSGAAFASRRVGRPQLLPYS